MWIRMQLALATAALTTDDCFHFGQVVEDEMVDDAFPFIGRQPDSSDFPAKNGIFFVIESRM